MINNPQIIALLPQLLCSLLVLLLLATIAWLSRQTAPFWHGATTTPVSWA